MKNENGKVELFNKLETCEHLYEMLNIVLNDKEIRDFFSLGKPEQQLLINKYIEENDHGASFSINIHISELENKTAQAAIVDKLIMKYEPIMSYIFELYEDIKNGLIKIDK